MQRFFSRVQKMCCSIEQKSAVNKKQTSFIMSCLHTFGPPLVNIHILPLQAAGSSHSPYSLSPSLPTFSTPLFLRRTRSAENEALPTCSADLTFRKVRSSDPTSWKSCLIENFGWSENKKENAFDSTKRCLGVLVGELCMCGVANVLCAIYLWN